MSDQIDTKENEEEVVDQNAGTQEEGTPAEPEDSSGGHIPEVVAEIGDSEAGVGDALAAFEESTTETGNASDSEAAEDGEDENHDPSEVRPKSVSGPAAYQPNQQRGRSRRVSSDIKIKDISYKNIPVLIRFLDGHGRILSRRKTHVSAKMQRKVVQAIKRARHLSLLPYTLEHTRITRLHG